MNWLRELCCIRRQKRYLTIDDDDDDEYDNLPVPEPAEIVGGGSEYFVSHLKGGMSSVYKKMSSWSLPKPRHVNLFTLNEEDLDFIIPSPPHSPVNFDDVVDNLV